MEPEVFLRCRKSDETLVQSVLEQAVQEYQVLMAKEVKMLKGKQPPCKISLDVGKYMPEYNENEAAESCIGGIFAHCKKGRITCSNTFDSRLALCYAEAIPDIRRILFPSFSRVPGSSA